MIYALRIRHGENERIHILNAIKGKIYFCEHCRDRLIPHQGEIMPWHFKHKENPTCTIGERSGRGCIINTNNNNGYCGGSIECEHECTLN